MRKAYIQKIKDEKGNFTIFSLFIILGIIGVTAILINLSVTYMTVNFSKKAMEESVRTRALAVDITLKEHEGVIEVIHLPYKKNPTLSYTNPTEDYIGNPVPQPGGPEYTAAVDDIEFYAKTSFAEAVSKSLLNNLYGQPMIDISLDNICYDVEPLPENDGYVEFSCALKDKDGNVYTAYTQQWVKGYNDLTEINHFEDETQNKTLRVSNVVFGAAIIEPRSFVMNLVGALGAERPMITIYSIAYPQIDSCYGEFCND